MSLKDRIAAQRKQIADSKAAYERSYRFVPGKTVFRILPGVVEDDDFSKPYGAHYLKDPLEPDGKPLVVVGDAEICYGQVCPVRTAITEFINKCNERGDEPAAGHAKSWLAKESYVCNVEIIDGVDVANKGKVVRVEFSRNQYDAVLSVADDFIKLDPNFSMKNGMVVQVERVGTGMNDTKYTFSYYAAAPTVPPPSSSVLSQRIDLQSYVDGKFGIGVTKALTFLSSLLGKDLTHGQIASATPNAPQLAAPVEQTVVPGIADNDTVPAFDTPPFDTTPQDAVFEPIVEEAPVQQAVVQQAPVQQAPVQQAPVQQAPVATQAADAGSFDAILAELNDL